jgi:hypothetical protein
MRREPHPPAARHGIRAVFGPELLLVVLGAILALGIDEWREQRSRTARAEMAMQSIYTEIQTNQRMVENARAFHVATRDTLRAYAAHGQLPPPRVYWEGGLFNPARVTSMAWQSAQTTSATADMPYELVLFLAQVYERQARYRAIGDALAESFLNDLRRDGLEATARDKFANFIVVDQDLANREDALVNTYRDAIERLRKVWGMGN